MERKIVALIPARGGSKRIPLKNVTLLYGIPLIGFTITAAKNCKVIDEIWISTDNPHVVDASLNCKIHHREEADDKQTLEDLMREFLSHSDIKDRFTDVVILQPTSPIRYNGQIDEAIDQYLNTKNNFHQPWNSLVSVVPKAEWRWKIYEGYAEPQFEVWNRKRSQDAQELFENGSIYISNIERFFNQYAGRTHMHDPTWTNMPITTRGIVRCPSPVLLYEMDKPGNEIDIDDELDLAKAEATIRYIRIKYASDKNSRQGDR